MVITALTRNQVVTQVARGFESHPVRQKEEQHEVLFFFLEISEERDSMGAGVNDSPVDCQSRDRACSQAGESHPVRQKEEQHEVLFFFLEISKERDSMGAGV